MKVKIAKWGNSLGVRLPKQFVDALDLKPGATVDLERDGSRLAIETTQPRRIPHYRLEDLLAQIPPGTKPPPYADWAAVEAPWPDDDWSDIAPSDAEFDDATKGRDKGTAEVTAAKKRTSNKRGAGKRSATVRRRKSA